MHPEVKTRGLLVRGQHLQAGLLRVPVRKIAPAGNPDKIFSIQCNENICFAKDRVITALSFSFHKAFFPFNSLA